MQGAGSLPVDIQDLAAAHCSCQDFQQAVTSPALTVLTAELDGVLVLVDSRMVFFTLWSPPPCFAPAYLRQSATWAMLACESPGTLLQVDMYGQAW
jgi:hypothetical protein